jgi:hypothetical protein
VLKALGIPAFAGMSGQQCQALWNKHGGAFEAALAQIIER